MLPASTIRIRLVGEELRRHREAAGWSLVEVSRRIGIDITKLSRMETGQYNQKCDEVAGLLAIYGIKGEDRKQLLELSRSADRPGLWQRSSSSLAQRIATLRILESRATKIINFESEVIPGLLQTVPYAQALMSNVGMVDEELIGDRVAARIARQGVLRKSGAPHFCAIIAENALHNIIGDKEILREQLGYLAEASRRSTINLRVIPRSVGNHPGFDGPFLRLQFTNRPSVIMLPNRTSTLFLEADEDRQLYNRALVELLAVALDHDESVALVRDLESRLA